MKLFVGALALALLMGCSSMAELRQSGPMAKYHSERPPQEVAECILFAWQGQKFGGQQWDAFMQPFQGGHTVFTPQQLEVADVVKSGQGSEIKFYAQGGLMQWRLNKRTDAINACATGKPT